MPPPPPSPLPSASTQGAIPFDSPQYSGPMQKSTKIGLFVGIVCFITIVLGFYMVSRSRRKPKPRTPQEEFNEQSLRRWRANMLRSSANSKNITGSVLEKDARLSRQSSLCSTESKASTMHGSLPIVSKVRQPKFSDFPLPAYPHPVARVDRRH
ncbi:hypothetical protein BD410DRAFT_791888 [Rickenella mellea]|uniref:Uncharacterized protein n=1 Tax=Rickenella mellea TaxID=50990 RepID=A0A4Y7PX63_9AGAM|nr:hypothetical protein BD410DRAFT_791888 [Rickenella mellea]